MTTGLIVEYNPMHIGHIQHAKAARQHANEPVIAVMSGWFVQRGEPAITDPYTRAAIAVQHGVDLVLLLPVIHSIQSAVYFAQGAVDILLAAKCSRIVFGSARPESFPAESEDDTLLQQALEQGNSYAAALQKARPESWLDANTRLGLCYAGAIRRRGADVSAVPVLRAPWTDSSVPPDGQNATAIREKLLAGVSASGLAAPVSEPYHSLDDYFSVLTHLILFPREDPSLFPYYEPGLDDRLKKTREGAASVSDWVGRARSKRHTMARIRRFLVHLLLGLTRTELAKFSGMEPPALVPLAMNDVGRAHLRRLKEDMTILSTKKALHRYCHRNPTPLAWDLRAEKLYYENQI